MKKLDLKPYTSLSLSSQKDELDLLEEILSSNCELQPKKINKPVILYGAGSLGRMAKKFFNYLNIPFLYLVDKNANQLKKDKFWQNTKIIHPDDVDEIDKNKCLLVICIVTTPLIALRDELKDNGWKDTAFFYDVAENYCDKYPLNNGWFLGKINNKEKKQINKVYLKLDDDISRAHYLQFLAWRKLRIELLFTNLEINNNNRFFIPEIIDVLRKDEVFVDCGAHHGSVTEKFLKIVDNKYKNIYAIEPDKINFKILKAKLKNTPNLNTIELALSNKNDEAKFYQGFEFASKLDENGSKVIGTITLDSLNIKASFIKTHLEGGDLKALKGATNTIKKYRPIIAVTIYHNSDGVQKIPLFLLNNTKNYNYCLRLHSWGGTGAVFYAIPKERVKHKLN
ncbi:FkbM family methyltransferase [Patescibacteria group bacterium]|nr:FkbM family methyltransferase [Patescibacteria group bacterium]MBU4601267.1 FkbM family methyltransferase [Patescibacteria group bacterium]MCG2697522.1 FkbM family methyltransferase [Candidatus Parcubacteria bacterium]